MNTDEEQVEKLKTWLKENGLSIVFGIIIGVGGIGGYNYWNHMQESNAEEASAHFSNMLQALDAGNGETLQAQADILLQDYASTDYALMAHLALARSQTMLDPTHAGERAQLSGDMLGSTLELPKVVTE